MKIFSTRYVLVMPAANVPMKVKVYQGELNLNEEHYRPVLEYLEQDNFRPKDLREFFRRATWTRSFFLKSS